MGASSKCIYEQKVAPLFACASISTDVIVTEHANHARDHLKTEAELKKYDGVVCGRGRHVQRDSSRPGLSNTGITEWTRTARRRSWYPVVSASALYPQGVAQSPPAQQNKTTSPCKDVSICSWEKSFG
ncbi:uncharacterized protein ACWYII_041333 [Salvelinus alpinus]